MLEDLVLIAPVLTQGPQLNGSEGKIHLLLLCIFTLPLAMSIFFALIMSKPCSFGQGPLGLRHLLIVHYMKP